MNWVGFLTNIPLACNSTELPCADSRQRTLSDRRRFREARLPQRRTRYHPQPDRAHLPWQEGPALVGEPWEDRRSLRERIVHDRRRILGRRERYFPALCRLDLPVEHDVYSFDQRHHHC